MTKKSGNAFLKFTALGTLFFFSASSVGWTQLAVPGPVAGEVLSARIQDPISLPEEFGTIQDQYLSPDKTKPFIVLIQDAHAMADAQNNIRRILGYLQEKYHISLVALEGGFGDIDFSAFRKFPYPAIVQ